MSHYVKETDAFLLMDDRSGEVLAECKEVAVVYDADSFTLLKHGGEVGTRAWMDKTRKTFADKGLGDLFNIQIAVFPLGTPVSLLNKIIQITGYMKVVTGVGKVLEEA